MSPSGAILLIGITLLVPGCATQTVEAPWTLDERDWKEYKLNAIAISAPPGLPLEPVGKDGWCLLLRWRGKLADDKICIAYSEVSVRLADREFRRYRDRMEQNRSIIFQTADTSRFKFASPVAYRNEDKTSGLTQSSEVFETSYGEGVSLGNGIQCSIEISKFHPPVSFGNWKYDEILTSEERQLVEKIASTVKLNN